MDRLRPLVHQTISVFEVLVDQRPHTDCRPAYVQAALRKRPGRDLSHNPQRKQDSVAIQILGLSIARAIEATPGEVFERDRAQSCASRTQVPVRVQSLQPGRQFLLKIITRRRRDLPSSE